MFVARGARDSAHTIMSVLIGIFLVEGLGFSRSTMGLLLGVSLAGGLALSFGVLLIGARVARRQSFVGVALLTSVAGALLLVTDNVWLLALGAFLGAYSASGGHMGPMIQLEQASLAQVSRPSERTRAFSNLTLASTAGRIAGGGLVGIASLLVEVHDFSLVDAHRVVFGIYISLNLLTAGIYALLSTAVEHRPAGAADAPQPRKWVNPAKATARKRIFGISALFGVDSFAGGVIHDTFLAVWLFTQFGVNEGTVGAVLVATRVASLVSVWLAPMVAARVGLLNTLVFSQVGSNVLIIAFAFAPTAGVAIALWVVHGLFNEMDVPTRQSYVMAIVPDDEREVMAATNNLGRSIGRVPSTSITGLLWSSSVNASPWIVGATIKLLYDAGAYFSFRKVRPAEERR